MMSDTDQPEDHQVLDARHLVCPLPVLKARKRLMQMQPGGRLEVLATDPAAMRDFPDFAKDSSEVVLESAQEADGVFRFVLLRA